MGTANECGHIEDLNAERIVSAKLETAPVRIDEHQLNVGLFRYNLVEPAAIKVVPPESLVQFLGLLVGDTVKVDAVEVLKRRKHVAIETGGAGVGEIMLGLGPPVCKLAARRPGSQRVDPTIVAAGPDAIERHALAMLGLHISGQPVERPEVVVRVDSWNSIELGLD